MMLVSKSPRKISKYSRITVCSPDFVRVNVNRVCGAGQTQLAKLAATILDVARKIPKELPWVLRVDGHTDRVPIATARYPSNWSLSTARALSVVNFLIEQDVPPNRLAATGFGEFQPLDDRDDEIAHRRNRRIEIKLTQR